MRIAYLEDNPAQAEVLIDWLTEAGYNCRHYADVPAFFKEVRRESFDLFVLDWELPGTSGIEVLKRIRSQVDWDAPVLFITQRDGNDDIVLALETGADDYIVKPISKNVTLARIKALLRRSNRDEKKGTTLEYGAYRIQTQEGLITVSGVPIELTEKEYQLALMLFSNVGRLLSRDHMLEMVWGVGPGLATRTVDTHISRLRRKLALAPENGWRLKAIYHHGYRLERVSQAEVKDAELQPSQAS